MAAIPVEDQLNIGSCGPNSEADDVRYDQSYNKQAITIPSRLFIYWITRMMMGTLGEDSGVSNADMMSALMKYGYCSEDMWTYENVDTKFLQQPPKECFDAALANRVTEAHQIPVDVGQMKAALAQGIDFVVGFTVYESFQSIGPDGVVHMPKRGEQILGGHDNLCVDYDDDLHGGCFITRNPWGPGFGDKGYLYFPYAFLASSQYGDDYWSATTVVNVPTPPVPPTPVPPTPTPVPPVPPTPTPVPVSGNMTVSVLYDGTLWIGTLTNGQ